MTPEEFSGDFREFTRKTLERADRLIRAVGIKTFSAIIKDTPVGDPDLWRSAPPEGYVGGRLRANWQCSLFAPDLTTTASTDHQGSIGRMQETVLPANRHDVLWLSNSLSYAERIEFEGWSTQAPHGMIRRNVARIKRIISGELRKLKL